MADSSVLLNLRYRIHPDGNYSLMTPYECKNYSWFQKKYTTMDISLPQLPENCMAHWTVPLFKGLHVCPEFRNFAVDVLDDDEEIKGELKEQNKKKEVKKTCYVFICIYMNC